MKAIGVNTPFSNLTETDTVEPPKRAVFIKEKSYKNSTMPLTVTRGQT